ncbi:endonuclease/exonuclease/phosphatase family protein [Streptomyces sp. WMMC940]|uniref:endonuclease/exonuclease/phosphatase family protein n=1 Tax=Streptomyces sp. WMMC940 TaxID=3015153 RepID=UPI0022B61F9C|nr:endonuclease/exonuclease/phosphatase family protein [Streptomyces sp. WMMC940]MCZ7462114.1 endonuclease/exonuclease/phosphatase family protein [Streptomyces sp. WMMC940]
MRSRDAVPVLVSVALACLLAFHSAVPDVAGNPGSLLETILPWLASAFPALLFLALLRRSLVAACAVLLPMTVWACVFGGRLLPPPGTARDDLTAVTHNISDENPDPAAAARELAGSGAGLIALQEVTGAALPELTAALEPRYPHHAVVGTVGLWSVHPLSDVRRVDIRPQGIAEGWDRGLRATVRLPGYGDVAVYVAHLPSVRLGWDRGFTTAHRDESARLLGAALSAEPLERTVLLGDLNGTVDDRALDPVLARLSPPRTGMAFSWPVSFPVARIDQIMARNATVAEVWSLPATGSDHLPVAARIGF